MKKIPQTQAISAKLAAIAREQKTNYAQVFTTFLLERAAIRLSSDKYLSNHLVFKGGFVGLKLYNSPRYTVDLDAVIKGSAQSEIEEKIKAIFSRDYLDHVFFIFDKKISLTTQSAYGGIRLRFRAGLYPIPENLSLAQRIDIDLGTGDPITPKAIKSKLPTLIDSGDFSWQVYPIETIIAEKLHAFITHGAINSRSKDLFDLNNYLPKSNNKNLKKALEATFKYRDTVLPRSLAKELKKMDLGQMEKSWKPMIARLGVKKDFNTTLALVIDHLREHSI